MVDVDDRWSSDHCDDVHWCRAATTMTMFVAAAAPLAQKKKKKNALSSFAAGDNGEDARNGVAGDLFGAAAFFGGF